MGWMGPTAPHRQHHPPLVGRFDSCLWWEYSNHWLQRWHNKVQLSCIEYCNLNSRPRVVQIIPSKHKYTIGDHSKNVIESMCFNTDKSLLASVGHDMVIKFWDVSSLMHTFMMPLMLHKGKCSFQFADARRSWKTATGNQSYHRHFPQHPQCCKLGFLQQPQLYPDKHPHCSSRCPTSTRRGLGKAEKEKEEIWRSEIENSQVFRGLVMR